VVAADLVEPLIGAVGAMVVAIVGGLVAVYAPGFKSKQDQSREVAQLEARYRQSLLTAANQLQSRFYNIAMMDFLPSYWQEDRLYTETSTLWLLGQYFGWVEIFRREAGLALGGDTRGDDLLALLEQISVTFARDDLSPQLRIFRSRQSAIAELMISDERHGGTSRIDCLGYATFVRRLRGDDFKQWFAQLSSDLERMATDEGQTLEALGERGRIKPLQHALVDLIEFLEAGRKSSIPSLARERI
jgi:hypothetical protein